MEDVEFVGTLTITVYHVIVDRWIAQACELKVSRSLLAGVVLFSRYTRAPAKMLSALCRKATRNSRIERCSYPSREASSSSSPQDLPASDRALNIPEILELILINASFANLQNARLVSRFWRNTIGGSETLDQTRYLKPIPAKGHNARTYSKAREQKKRAVEEERIEFEERARALADSPLLRDAIRKMKAPAPLQGQTKPSLLDETIIEYSSEDSV